MRGKEIIRSLVLTLAILSVVEMINTAMLPAIGLTYYRIPFNILIILYFGFKLESPYIGLLILAVQLFHSLFSIEGWEMGTISGILICLLISYFKELLHFTSYLATILVTQIFQISFFVVLSFLWYLKLGNVELILSRFWRFLPESIFISLLAPFFFAIFDVIWKSGKSSMLQDGV
jgi:hypothetical protein